MSILKLKPACKEYIWGGRRLIEEYAKDYDGESLAETWELSCHPDGPSVIVNGSHAGETLREYIEKEGKHVLGANCARFEDFPILVKLIDARESSSIQVHPDDAYALKNEGQSGKTEMWYVVDAGEGASLYYGFKENISRDEFRQRIENDTLTEVLNRVYVKKGDILFIEAGTIHAIGRDMLLAEIQQNSNVTYRVYDYGRTDKHGNRRRLHIDKALDVTNRVPAAAEPDCRPHLADCEYFTVDKLELDGVRESSLEVTVSDSTFAGILILDGRGEISDRTERLPFAKGDCFFLPAGDGVCRIEGVCEALLVTVRG